MPKNQITVDTPIGSLLFNIIAAEGSIDDVHFSDCEIKPNIPKGMTVDGCRAVLLRCTSITPLKDIIYSCSWKDLKEVGYGNSGEGLEAWEWKHHKTLVMVGTEDDEFLESRLRLKKSSSNDYSITMNDNAIKIHISEFPANKELSLHFVISWNSLPEKVDSSCWFALDIPHKKILQE